MNANSSKLANIAGTVIVSAISFIQVFTLGNIAPVRAADYCQCVEYIKRIYNIPSDVRVNDAKDMIYSLPKLGFSQVDVQVGAVAIMQPSFPGSDRAVGHVARVIQVRRVGGRTYITLRGANQGGSGLDANCSNVNNWRVRTPIDGHSDISFWQPG